MDRGYGELVLDRLSAVITDHELSQIATREIPETGCELGVARGFSEDGSELRTSGLSLVVSVLQWPLHRRPFRLRAPEDPLGVGWTATSKMKAE